ncbi:MAG: glutamate-5-semialdehyde dehydrogenase, partial [Alicyclobacillus sp.]|nr:glutamate-5-semialdehyde dehydrogenase [Alicyclobacillus sp.]
MALSVEGRTQVEAQLRAAKAAARSLAPLSRAEKDQALRAMGEAIWADRTAILAANQADLERAHAAGESKARIDRLMLDERRLQQVIQGLEQVAALPDPVGQVEAAWTRPNGLQIEKVRVPFGVIAIIYESRPNVTVDAAALALKTGNAVVLRGGKEAQSSNAALTAAMRRGLQATGVPEEALQFVAVPDRAVVDMLIRAKGFVDLAIPRGGAGLIQHVVEHALVPVIETGVGNCHVYVDAKADLDMAVEIVVNAKVQRPSVCNAAETLLVHQAVASAFLPRVGRALTDRAVELRACAESFALLQGVVPTSLLRRAEEQDWSTEYLDLRMAVKVVHSLDEAVQHINHYGTQHSEAIVTADAEAAARFFNGVDAAAVYHNASTRFTDGFEFGFGAEMGISTQKLHARGPMGLPELTTY